MKKRTRARELALQALYQIDLIRGAETSAVDHVLAGGQATPAVAAHARDLVDGVLRFRDELDEKLKDLALHWDWSRMAIIDRNVLRLGLYEMLHHPEVPPKVALNEAIELAKRFSTEHSGAFVNGILDQAMLRHVHTVRPAAESNGTATEEA